MRLLVRASLIAWVGLVAVSTVAEARQVSSAETIEINGKKTPELVPEYSSWRQALRMIGPSRDELPAQLYVVATPADVTLIFDERLRLDSVEKECIARLLEAREPLRKLEAAGDSIGQHLELAKTIDAQMWKIELGCRYETIKTRDRLLATLTPPTAKAFRAFVDIVKAGMSFAVPKNGLERFRQPE